MGKLEQKVTIDCANCKARVQAKILAERNYSPGEDWDPFNYSFVECTTCANVMVGYSEWGMTSPEDEGWLAQTRVWPEPEQQIHSNVPNAVCISLEEAKKCYNAKAFMACAVMCGRAIEGISKDKTAAKYLGEGLKKLQTAKIIDEKLFEWGETLRSERNIGAHAGDETISAQNARDVLDFALAITEYVYVLDEKYKAYKDRKAKKIT
jgi:hypothetical protein